MIKTKYLNTMSTLILHDDDTNSSLKIKVALISICEYEPNAALQCIIIAEGRGKVNIKEGDFIELFALQNEFEELNINTELIA